MITKRTKIVATIGPASSSPKVIEALIRAGLNVARLNFSHGTYAERKEQIKTIRVIARKLNKSVAIMADLQGPKLRLGFLKGDRKIKKGESISLSINPLPDEIPMQFDLSPYVKKGERIFLNDGLVELKVKGVNKNTILTHAQNEGIISSNKGVNIPDTKIENHSFTQKDKKDLEFVLKEGVDFVALSFVRTADDLKAAKIIIEKSKKSVQIIAKIEKKEAVLNLEEIIKETDAVMVARGDLGIEIRGSQVPLVQQKIVNLARQFQKPVIVATQMLESMIHNPRPTRAEASDVAHAVLNEVDAVILSAETAAGAYPVEAVKMMNEIILSVEEHQQFKHFIQIDWRNIPPKQKPISAIVSSAANIAYRIGAKTVVIATTAGHSAKILASFRPEAKIIAIVHNDQVRNQLQMVWGVESFKIKGAKNYNIFWKEVISAIKKNKVAEKDDKVVIVSGSLIGVSGTTDTIKIVTI
ncbi:pyruvate kinase [Candidatus Daviesbacteria bacterium]|nr:pyruvate kinase [Candidatus Daviesbacteria bacterium]